MRKFSVALLFFILSWKIVLADDELPPSQLTAPISTGWTMSISASISGSNYWANIGPSDVTNGPTWSLKGNPPVSVGDAVRLATKSLADSLGDLEGWHRGNITLEELSKGYWAYDINFVGDPYKVPGSGSDELNFNSSVTVCVFMDGHAVCPKVPNYKRNASTKQQ